MRASAPSPRAALASSEASGIDRTSKYYYLAGFNPVGFVAFAAGIVTYIYLLDPVTYVYRSPFQYLSASFPAALVAGVVYVVGVMVFFRPRGIGGYGDADLPAPATRDLTTTSD